MVSLSENSLPGNARVWVYQSIRKLNPSEVTTTRNELIAFVNEWTSHKMEVQGCAQLLYNRFVVLMADDAQVKLGGCSIDSSVRFVKGLEAKINTVFFDRWNIAFKKGDEVHSCRRKEFEKLVQIGEINDNTVVFNNLVQTKDELLTKWEVPYKDSWHKNLAEAHTSFSSIL